MCNRRTKCETEYLGELGYDLIEIIYLDICTYYSI